MLEARRSSYDEVPYESNPFSQTHPDRLATVAKLLGLNPAPSTHCRVLELGCASGGNLIPMAYALPESQFLGVDLSQVQIAEGQKTIKALGLKNIELKHLSIVEVGPEIGKFDYIICHGVYSWVAAPVQEAILGLSVRHLQPRGIAYVSYNTFPGWHMRGMIRDMVSYHAKQFAEPATRVKQARNLLDFLARAAVNDNGPYGLLLRNELESIRQCSDSYLYHEHLEEVNEPVYFHEFVDKVAAAGLKYLGDVDLRFMVPGNYPPEIENVLQMLSQDLVHMEQYMDFLRNRTFRQTLLCHKNLQPNYGLRWEQLRSFHVASPAKPGRSRLPGGTGQREAASTQPESEDKARTLDIHSTEPALFETPLGLTLTSRDPIVKAAMVALGDVWPGTLSFTELVREARPRLGRKDDPAADEQALGQALLTFYAQASTSLVELWLHSPKFAPKASSRPLASPLARYQAETQSRVTNMRHDSVFLGEFERQLLLLLDGTRDRAALAENIQRMVHAGDLTMHENQQPLGAVERQLGSIARNALLVG